MKRLIIILAAIAAFGGDLEHAIELPESIEPLGIAADGLGTIFILESGGSVIAMTADGEISARIEPTAISADITNLSDISFSAGWLYLADREGSALFITDKTLRSPMKIPLQNNRNEIRPSRFAVSTDGRIMISDDDRGALYILSSWKDLKPLELVLPEFGDVRGVFFDRIEKVFSVVTDEEVFTYSLFGLLERRLEIGAVKEPIAAFTLQDEFCIIGRRSGAVFGADSLKIVDFRAPIVAVSQDLSARLTVVSEGRIFQIESLRDLATDR